MRAFTLALLSIAAGCFGSPRKLTFARECDREGYQEQNKTIRGRMVLPHIATGWNCTERGCPVPISASDDDAAPYITAYLFPGQEIGTFVPLGDNSNLIRDLRVNAVDGRKARWGQRVELTGDFTTYYGCRMVNVHSFRVLDPLRPGQLEP